MDDESIKLILLIFEMSGNLLLVLGSMIALWKTSFTSISEIYKVSATMMGHNLTLRDKLFRERKIARIGVGLVAAGFVIQTVAKIGLLNY